MSSVRRVLLALIASLALPTVATADPIIDFSTLSPTGNATNLGILINHGGINALGAYFSAAGWAPADLVARNVTDDNGLGVCSPDENGSVERNRCEFGAPGGGDYNELSQLLNQEGIILSKPDTWTWTGIWLSSLDGNSTEEQGLENGILRWGNTFDLTNPNLLTDGGSATFTFPAFGPGEFEGMLTLPANFDPTARFLFFMPGGNIGENNDYLVWGVDVREPRGDVPVPEPASLLLVGSGLIGLARARRRSRH